MVFQKELVIEDALSNPTIYTTSPLDGDWPLVVGDSGCLPHDLFRTL